MTDSEERTLDLYCDSCNVQVAAKVLYAHAVTVPGQFVIDPDSDPVKITEYAFSVCSRCDSPFLTRQNYLEVPGEFSAPQDDAVVLFPGPRGFELEGLPPVVARTYATAAKSFRAGLYEPCAIMCGKCLEAVCSESGAQGRNLVKQLESLRQAGVIDDRLFTWANGVRIFRNDAAHDLTIIVSEADALDALQLTEAILLYIFVLGSRFKQFSARRSQRKAANPAAQPDGYAAG